MEEPIASLPSGVSEGEDVCLICLQTYTDKNINCDDGALEHLQNVFGKVSKYLSSEIFEGVFQWNFIKQRSSPVCFSCYSSIEKIFKIHEMIEKLHSTVQEVINSFTCEVLGRHNKLKLLFTTENDSDKSQDEKTTKTIHEPDNDIDIIKEEDDYIVDEVTDADLLTDNSAENEADFGFDDDFDVLDQDNELTNCCRKDSNDHIRANDYSLQYPNIHLKQLKIILTRLELGSSEVSTTSKSEEGARPRRKAALAACASMKTIVNDSQKPFESTKTVGAREDRPRSKRKSVLTVRNVCDDRKWASEFLSGQSESDSEYSDASSSEKLVDRRKEKLKFKTSQRTKIFEVAKRFRCQIESCKLSFNFTKKLKSHSSKSGHSNNKIFKCDKNCPENFFNQTELKNHVKFYHKRSSFRCKSCPKIFKTKEILKIHHRYSHTEKLYKCDICNQAFFRKLNLSRHKIVHTGKSFQCESCHDKFIGRISLKLHVDSKHNKVKYNCSLCSKTFSSKLKFTRHRLTHFKSKIRKIYPCTGCKKIHFVENIWDSCIINHFRRKDYRGFTCAICGLEFSRSNQLDYHSKEKRHINKKLFQCHVCKKRYYKYDNLSKCHKQYLETETEEKPKEKSFPCPICSKTFKTEKYIAVHVKTHSTDEQFKCTHCDLSFNLKGKLERHELSVHSDDRPFPCTLCDAKFKCQSYLSRHIIRVHRNPVSCDECGKKFASSDNLRVHLKKHKGTLHQCTYEFCTRKFYDNTRLRDHIKVVHTKEIQYSCDLCQKTFPSSFSLNKHLRTHTGEKPFPCENCDKKFPTKRNLKAHIDRVHSEKKYQCDVCDKYFSGKDILKAHWNVVHGEKKFQCEFCPYLCRLKQHLNLHIEAKHSGQKPFVCEVCGKTFARKDVLGGHMKWHEKVKARENESKSKDIDADTSD